MDETNILARLALYRGLSAGEAAQYSGMAHEAALRLEAMRGDAAGGEALLEGAAAAFVNWQLALLDAGEDFSAGEVRISRSRAAADARALWESALAGAAPYLRDNGFRFQRVPS